MDSRNREARKRYRNSDKDILYKTISMTLDSKLIKALELKIEQEPDKNMSRFIEDCVSENLKKKNDKVVTPARRPYRTIPEKKTFTFTQNFVKKIDTLSPKRSFFIETILIDELDIKTS